MSTSAKNCINIFLGTELCKEKQVYGITEIPEFPKNKAYYDTLLEMKNFNESLTS